LITKVLETGADGGDEWTCDDAASLKPVLAEVDADFANRGFKTIGLAMSRNGGNMKFQGIVPMLDPPRDDTKQTIKEIREAGIAVKMATGDHLNIAKELARQIDLGTNIYANTELWPESAERDRRIALGDGFAQVTPKDKHEIVTVLKKQGNIVGMTGDGVNDAPALTAANIGIAVADATDAARSAADIVLTEAGLYPIFTAIMESRCIFGRIRSYVYYRLAASVHVVLYLSLLIFAYTQEIKSIYIVLLALLNDVTTITVAYDHVKPSPIPVDPTVKQPLIVAVTMGLFLFLQSFVWFLLNQGGDSFLGIYQSNAKYNLAEMINAVQNNTTPDIDNYLHAVLFLQMFVSVELLIFVTRAQSWFIVSRPLPHWALAASVFLALIVVTVLMGVGAGFPKIEWAAIGWTWLYCFVWIWIMDAIKMMLFTILYRPDKKLDVHDEPAKFDVSTRNLPAVGDTSVEMPAEPQAASTNFFSNSWNLSPGMSSGPPGVAARMKFDSSRRVSALNASMR